LETKEEKNEGVFNETPPINEANLATGIMLKDLLAKKTIVGNLQSQSTT